MEFIDKELEDYAAAHSSPQSALLEKIERETHLQVSMPRMLSGHLQGRFLAMVSHMLQPKMVVEVGTYTGYSALCFAEGLHPDGRLVTIDINAELERRVRGYFSESPYAKQIDYRIADAAEELKRIEGPIDLAFIDADKVNYGTYYDLLVPKLRQGGFLLGDNVLWSGKVLEKNRSKLDKSTKAILAFNQAVAADQRVEKVLLPLRDGVMVVRKR